MSTIGNAIEKIEDEVDAVVEKIEEEFGKRPTVDEAKAMFEGNPGLAHVLTDEGMMSRDGTIVPA